MATEVAQDASCTSLEYAHICADGLQCAYHGWIFDARGRCVDMPLEPADSAAKHKVRHVWYPVVEWSGVVWCYMGPDKESPPALPKIDILARTDGEIQVTRGDFRDYGYLNFLENFADIGHAYVLHTLALPAVPADIAPYHNNTVDMNFRRSTFKAFETHFGLKNVVVHNTADPDIKYVNTWSLALPTFYRFGSMTAGLPPDFTNDRRESGGLLRIIDDEHFEIFRYQLIRPGNYRGSYLPQRADARGLDQGLHGTVDPKPYDKRKYRGYEGVAPVEDLMIQEAQGAIAPREDEFLVSSDVGVALLRRIYRKSMNDVAKGERPKPVITNKNGIIEVDTFKGFANMNEIRLGPENMPSSEDGRGLIRDDSGRLVFA